MTVPLLGTDAHTVYRRRYGAGPTYTPTDLLISSSCSVQPASSGALDILPKDFRTRFPIEVESYIELRRDDTRTDVIPDDLVVDGNVYDLAILEDCNALGPIPRHWYGILIAVGDETTVKVRTVTPDGTGLELLDPADAPSNADLQIHHPRPWVTDFIVRDAEPGGIYQAGDRMVKRISRRFTRAQLDPGGTSHWLINDEPHSLVKLEPADFEWTAVVRRMRRP